LLENPEIPKIGVNILSEFAVFSSGTFFKFVILDDGRKLFRDHGILAKNLVELGALALLVDPVGSQERSKSKRKIVSLVKVSLFIYLFIIRYLSDYTLKTHTHTQIQIDLYSLSNGTAEWK
jgi:hypothetical protein